jgi:hypothetical protein
MCRVDDRLIPESAVNLMASSTTAPARREPFPQNREEPKKPVTTGHVLTSVGFKLAIHISAVARELAGHRGATPLSPPRQLVRLPPSG